MSDPGVFSQHQGIERDTSGMAPASGAFHQHVPAGYMDFPKVGVKFSIYIMIFLCFLYFLFCVVPNLSFSSFGGAQEIYHIWI